MKAEISRNPDAIGYLSLGSLDNTVRALSVENVVPSTENVVNQTYRIARPFLLLTKKGKPLNSETQAFLDWILTPAGQAIVKKSWISVRGGILKTWTRKLQDGLLYGISPSRSLIRAGL